MPTSEKAELQEVLKDYWIGKKLGTGARSVVYDLKRKSDGYSFAVKYVNVRGPEDLRVIGHMENEWRVLQAVHNPKTQASELIIRPEGFKKVK